MPFDNTVPNLPRAYITKGRGQAIIAARLSQTLLDLRTGQIQALQGEGDGYTASA